MDAKDASGNEKAGIAYAIAARAGSLAPCFQDEIKKLWTPEMIASLWKTFQEEYSDKNASLEDAIPEFSKQLAVKPEVVLYAFIKPPGVPRKVIKRMWAAHQRSLLAKHRARELIAAMGTPEWDKLANMSKWRESWQKWQERRIAKRQARDIMRLFS